MDRTSWGIWALTPATCFYIPRSKLSEELSWWWGLKKRVFEAVVPDRAFGTEDKWRVVSQNVPLRDCSSKMCLLSPACVDVCIIGTFLILHRMRSGSEKLWKFAKSNNIWGRLPLRHHQTPRSPPLLKEHAWRFPSIPWKLQPTPKSPQT